jgi:hypothetical protein
MARYVAAGRRCIHIRGKQTGDYIFFPVFYPTTFLPAIDWSTFAVNVLLL